MKKGAYIRCDSCGKFGNMVTSGCWNEQIDCEQPTEECPHCGSEAIAENVTAEQAISKPPVDIDDLPF